VRNHVDCVWFAKDEKSGYISRASHDIYGLWEGWILINGTPALAELMTDDLLAILLNAVRKRGELEDRGNHLQYAMRAFAAQVKGARETGDVGIAAADRGGYVAVLRSLSEEQPLKDVFFYVSSGPGYRVDRYEAASSRLGLDRMRHEFAVNMDESDPSTGVDWDKKAEGGNEAFLLTACEGVARRTDSPWGVGKTAVDALLDETYRSVVGAAVGGVVSWLSSAVTNSAAAGSKSVCQRAHELLDPRRTPTAVSLVEIRRKHLLPKIYVQPVKISRWDD
jgi:hypothetical protein